MEVRLVLSPGYMADFERYHTLLWERDRVEEKRVHEHDGNFLAGKSSKDCYTRRHQLCFSKSLSWRLLNAGTRTGKCFRRVSAFYILSKVSATARWQSREKGLGRSLGWLALPVLAVLRTKRWGSQKVCASPGEDFAVWLTSSPPLYWEYVLCVIVSYTVAEKNLRNEKLLKPDNSSVT